MQISQKYLHDRIVLLLLSVNAFLTLLGSVLIFLQLGSGQSGRVIIAYRPNLGINAYTPGRLGDFFAFILFLLVTLGLNVALSARIYRKHRSYALTVLGLGTLVSVITIIVSNALLMLG
jgi:hypothetical protein